MEKVAGSDEVIAKSKGNRRTETTTKSTESIENKPLLGYWSEE